jgi:hypothetical protein
MGMIFVLMIVLFIVVQNRSDFFLGHLAKGFVQ